MKKLCFLCIALTAAAAMSFHAPSARATSEKMFRSSQAVPNRYIVVLEDDAFRGETESAAIIAGELSREFPGTVDRVFSSALRGYAVEMDAETAEMLSRDPRIKYVEEDGIVSASSVQYGVSWGLDRVDQHLMPMDTTYNYSRNGNGVHVYIIDSGILTSHAEFEGRAIDSLDLIRDPRPLEQCNGHGTNVAGIVGSATYGVAKSTTLHSVRVLGCDGYGTVSDVLQGIDWVTRHAITPAVANMSLGGGYSRTMNDAVTSSSAAGITYVVAAGNETDDACRHSPASASAAITAGASTRLDERLYNTNYGSCVDLFAPGLGVETTGVQAAYPVVFVSGTSFSSPYVAGAAALYLEAHPSASPAEVQSAVVANATPDLLTNIGNGSPNLLLFSVFPEPGEGSCAGVTYSGILPGTGSSDFQSSSAGFAGRTGRYTGGLRVPDGLAFRLSLEKKSKARWSTVASSSGSGSEQTIAYSGKSGTYRWTITSISGTGTYSLCASNP
jgi:subtilisin family serine protease